MKTRLTAATLAAATTLALAPAASAEPAPVTGVELNVPVSQTVAVNSKFDYSVGERGMAEFRKLRADMWDRNPYYVQGGQASSTRLRDVAAKYGITTKEQYVNRVSYDSGLSIIGVQRAAEQFPLKADKLSHSRPAPANCASSTGLACTDSRTATLNGVGALENLAWGSGTSWTIEQFVHDWGYGELKGMEAAGGQFHGGGHLWQFLNPEWTHIGFGLVNVYVNGQWHTFAAAPFSAQTTGVASAPAGVQNVNLYRPAEAGETPTGLQAYKAPPAPKSNFGNADSGDLSSDPSKIIGIILGVLSIISALAGIARQLGILK